MGNEKAADARMGGVVSIRNEAGIDNSNKYGSDAVRGALYESGYSKSDGKKTGILTKGVPHQTIKNDEGMQESNKYGEQLSNSVDSSKTYKGKNMGGGKGYKVGYSYTETGKCIANDEGIGESNTYGTAAIKVRDMSHEIDFGKSGMARVKSVKIPWASISSSEMKKSGGDYEEKEEMGHKKGNDEGGVDNY